MKNQRDDDNESKICFNADGKRIYNAVKGDADTDAITMIQLVDAMEVLETVFKVYSKQEFIDFARTIKKEFKKSRCLQRKVNKLEIIMGFVIG